jgi:hypothetical protein
MTHMTIDPGLSARLNQLSLPTTLCDPSGKVLGRFFPSANMEEWIAVSPDISDEELDRRMKSNERRYTTAELLAYLEKL